MPDLVKLAIGETITVQVKTVSVDRAGKWPDYHITAQDGRIIVAPQGALDRQLERLTMSPVELVGHYITIERAPNKDDAKKSWWNLSLANKSEATAAPSRRLPAPDTRTTGQRILDEAVPPDNGPPAHHREAGVPDSPDPIVEAAAEALDAFAAKRGALIDGYLQLYAYVAPKVCAIGRENDFPVDSIGINNATATVFIALDKRNLL